MSESSGETTLGPLPTGSKPGMVWIPGGTFLMGSDHHYPEEAPAHKVTVGGFWMDAARRHEPRVRPLRRGDRLRHAGRAAGECRRTIPGAKPEMLVPSSVVFRQAPAPVDLQQHYNWWTYMRRRRLAASARAGQLAAGLWRSPGGARGLRGRGGLREVGGQGAADRGRMGVRRARRARRRRVSPGATSSCPNGKPMANTWQGEFPWQNLLEDGYEGTAPVGSFPPNGYGLHEMAGNVWEWTTDWYQEHGKIEHACCTLDNPRGGEREDSFDPRHARVTIPRKVMKGGSYLCAPNYCRRYRPAARMAQAVDTSTCHLGFRCIKWNCRGRRRRMRRDVCCFRLCSHCSAAIRQPLSRVGRSPRLAVVAAIRTFTIFSSRSR